MSKSADIYAIGKFSSTIELHLEYPPHWYEGVLEGEVIFTKVFATYTSETSEMMAEGFGISSTDFGKHCLCADSVKLGILRAIFTNEEVVSFLKLKESGFKFFYHLEA